MLPKLGSRGLRDLRHWSDSERIDEDSEELRSSESSKIIKRESLHSTAEAGSTRQLICVGANCHFEPVDYRVAFVDFKAKKNPKPFRYFALETLEPPDFNNLRSNFEEASTVTTYFNC